MQKYYDFFQHELRGFVLRRVRDNMLADDILQDVFIKILHKQSQVSDKARIYNWIYQVTQNTIIDHYRKQSRILSLYELDWESDPLNFNACVVEYIKDFIPLLPPIYREALQMVEIEQIPQTELSTRLGISYSGAKSRLQRAKQLLRSKLEAELILKADCYGNILMCKDRKPCC